MANKLIITGNDLIKGWAQDKSYSMYECTPWQLLEENAKTKEWKEWVANYFEYVGLQQVKYKHRRILKNRRMAAGILDMDDYAAQSGELAHLMNIDLPDNISEPFSKFHPFVPPVIKVLDGEFIKRNTKIHVYCTDRKTVDEKTEYKTKMFNEVMVKYAQARKQELLISSGLGPVDMESLTNATDEQVQQAQQQTEQFYSEMDAARELAEVENKYRTYRHVFENFAQHVHNKDYDRFKMGELEREAFVETLCNSEEWFWLDMKEDRYIPRFLDSANTFYHMSGSVKYASQGDYIGYFEDMTLGDVINVLGRELTSDQLETLKNEFSNFNMGPNTSGIMTDDQKGHQGAYYDTTKPHPLGQVNKGMAQFYQDRNVEELLGVNKNFVHEFDSSKLLSVFGKSTSYYKPKMFRVMFLQFKSQSKIGWLTKKDNSGLTVYQDWVDENYVVTVKPKYDKSLKNEETKENLVFGEHIDWEWRNEWRTIKKINSNTEHSFWQNRTTTFNPIYIGGDRNEFQFSGEDPFECYPAAEGTQFRMKQTRPVSLVDLAAPTQINLNIAMNKVPQIMFDDVGIVMAYNKNAINFNKAGIQSGKDPLDVFMDNLYNNKLIETHIDPELARSMGNNVQTMPQILDYSRIKEGIQYMQIAAMIKQEGMEILGISRQRLAQAKASESATGIEAGVNFSETQTEPYFHQHIVEFMPRVYQRMIEAAQYYCSKSESGRVYYQTTNEENIFLEIEDMKGLPKTYNIKITSDIKEQKLKQKLEQLFMHNNTTDTGMLDLASGIALDSVSEVMEQLRKSQIAKEQKEQEAYERQAASEEAQRKFLLEQGEIDFSKEVKLLEMKLESAERQALTRALGGIGTDANQNSEIDSYENIERALKEKQLSINDNYNNAKLNLEKEKQLSNAALTREQLQSKERIENKKLAIALANQNKNDDKKLNRSIAKSQLK